MLTLTDLRQDFIFALNFLEHKQCHTSYRFLLAVVQWMLANFAWSPSKTELISVKGANGKGISGLVKQTSSIMKEMLYEVRYLKSSEDMILALAGQFKQQVNKLTCSQLCMTSLLSWLEHCTGIGEVMGSNPVESPEFFRFMRQLLKLSSQCEDHIFT